MKMTLMIATLLHMTWAYAQQSNADKLAQVGNLQRLAFGSCNKQYKEQLLWKDLILQAPDLFIWGGDNIYANTKDGDDILRAYKKQNEVEDYKFFKALTPIVGTWDDHDYGNNDEDGHYPLKRYSREFALDFFEEPKLSPRRLREGIYTSYNFGDAGKRIKIILIDNRYFKDLDKNVPLLGEAQWSWLEEELNTSDASLHLIVSGTSVIAPAAPGSEEWADYPAERWRLRNALEKSGRPYLYLTGDKHFSSIFRNNGELEFMSSGMTHVTRLPLRPYVLAKYPNPVFMYNYGLIDFAWENSSPILTLTIRTAYGQSLIIKKIRWEKGLWIEI